MALQTSGAISLANIQTEFGGANPKSISEYYGVGTVPASGTISLSHFYGQTARAPAGSKTFTASGTFTVPIGWTSVTLSICGGGGSGSRTRAGNAIGGGGNRGNYSYSSVAVTPGQQISVTIGAGGASVAGGSYMNGLAGGSSSFGGTTMPGGSGGLHSSTTYNGTGAAFSTPDGRTTYDGGYIVYAGHNIYGGKAGMFGNGGAGAIINAVGYGGGVGAGGGCQGNHTTYGSGPGGRGQVVISWG